MSDYAAKIAALLAKAESTDSAHEAEALTKAAERLMVKWGVSEAMAAAAAGDRAKVEDIVQKSEDLEGIYHQALMRLANSAALGLGGLRLIQTTYGSRNRTTIHVVGHESDVERFFTLFRSLRIQAESAMREWWKSTGRTIWFLDSKADGFRARRQFIISFGNAVYERLTDARRTEVAEQGAELVLVSRDQRVDVEVGRMFPSLRTTQSRLQGSRSGREAGFRAGQRANLGQSRELAR